MRTRQPPAHLVAPVQTMAPAAGAGYSPSGGGGGGTMVRSASIADYTAYSGDSYTLAGSSGGGGGSVGTPVSCKSASGVRLLPKGGRNRVSLLFL